MSKTLLGATRALIALAVKLHHKLIAYLKAELDRATEAMAERAVAARMAANAMAVKADAASDDYIKTYSDNLKAHSELDAHANLTITSAATAA